VADAVAGGGKPRASSRAGSSSGGVTALQDVGPVQVGRIDTSALDDLNLQLVLPADAGATASVGAGGGQAAGGRSHPVGLVQPGTFGDEPSAPALPAAPYTPVSQTLDMNTLLVWEAMYSKFIADNDPNMEKYDYRGIAAGFKENYDLIVKNDLAVALDRQKLEIFAGIGLGVALSPVTLPLGASGADLYQAGRGFVYANAFRLSMAGAIGADIGAGTQVNSYLRAGPVLASAAERVAIGEGGGAARFTFRGDSRGPDVIFNEGFAPRGSSTDLLAHAFDNTLPPPSAYVSTSKSAEVAAGFADNVYVVRSTNGIDVNRVLGPASPFPNELEIAIPGRVLPGNVRAVTLPNRGVSILNPNYKP